MSEMTPEIWEQVYRQDPESQPIPKRQNLTWVCRACGRKKPVHASNCPIAILEARIEALEKAVAEAYWKGHGDGRIWGKKPISAETFEIGGRAIHTALAAKPK